MDAIVEKCATHADCFLVPVTGQHVQLKYFQFIHPDHVRTGDVVLDQPTTEEERAALLEKWLKGVPEDERAEAAAEMRPSPDCTLAVMRSIGR